MPVVIDPNCRIDLVVCDECAAYGVAIWTGDVVCHALDKKKAVFSRCAMKKGVFYDQSSEAYHANGHITPSGIA